MHRINKLSKVTDKAGKTYHVNDLLQSYAESEKQRLGLVDNGSFQQVVVAHQVIQQLFLVVSAYGLWESTRITDRVFSFIERSKC